jgi:hypothetical protein
MADVAVDSPIDVDLAGDPAAAERHRRATGLVEVAGGRREMLEEMQSRLIARLHGAGDDFAAIEDLRVVEAALSMVSRPVGLWAWQERERQRRVRWWGRRRSDLRREAAGAR